jgi:hypothetical protein
MKPKKEQEIVNYGTVLDNEIKQKGYSKTAICKALGMAFHTLQNRLVDGKFSQDELKKLKELRYIP